MRVCRTTIDGRHVEIEYDKYGNIQEVTISGKTHKTLRMDDRTKDRYIDKHFDVLVEAVYEDDK